jgi:anti-sigma factor RsiW
MNRQISSLDWQNLSDYLDNQLSPDGKRKLEADLRQYPELKQALEDLRLTRVMLKSLPHRRAPKNYTLSQKNLPRRIPAFPFVPAFSLASALCTILLVLSFVFQSGASAAAATDVNMAPQAKSAAPMAAESVSNGPTPQVFVWGGPALAHGMGGFGGGGGDGNAMAAPAAPAIVPPGATMPTAEMAAKLTPTETPAPPPSPAAAPLPASQPLEDGGPILGLRPAPEQGVETGASAFDQNRLTPETPAKAEQPAFPLLQVLFGALAALFAMGAVVFALRYRR